MPVITSRYRPPFWLRQSDMQTLYSALLRRAPVIPYQRASIPTPDGDILHCDWSRSGNTRVAVLSHGLEGHSNRRYMRGMASALNRAGWDVCAWNFRFCASGPNKKLRMTHNGSTDDLQCVIRHALESNPKYKKLALVGFSMGGNITLLYLGQNPDRLPPELARSICISVPCHLEGCAARLSQSRNRIYLHKFLRTMKPKMETLNRIHGNALNINDMDSIQSFEAFDDRFTAPMHGFKNARDYWTRCSSLYVLHKIGTPTLLLSAMDDSFLSEECYPYEIASNSAALSFETPKHGGHVGFVSFNSAGGFYSEERAVEWLSEDT